MYAIINNKTIGIKSFSMNERQNEIGTFDIEVPAIDIVGLGNLHLKDISVFKNGTLIVSGIIRTPNYYPMFSSSLSSPSFIRLKCDNNLGRLACDVSQLNHYQNIPISVIVADLLSSAVLSTWSLNDITTLTDSEITIDLRSKETLFSQVAEVLIKADEPTFMRYGGLSGSTHLLDIGSFGEHLDNMRSFYFVSPPQYNEPTEQPLKKIFPVSGESSDVPVNIADALNINPSLGLPTANFQIIVSDGSVRNNLFDGCYTRRSYNTIKTKNDVEPTQSEKNQTALALYRATRKDMQQSRPYYTVNCTCALNQVPSLNDKFLFDGSVYESSYNFLDEETIIRKTFDVTSWMRILGYSANYTDTTFIENTLQEEDEEVFVFNLELSTRDVVEIYNDTELINEKLEKTDVYDLSTSVVTFYGISNVTVNHSGVASNCSLDVFGVPTNGRQFTFAAPSAPAGATDATVVVKTISDPTVEYEYIQFGDIGVNAILCVSGTNGTNWNVGSNVTITLSWLFT